MQCSVLKYFILVLSGFFCSSPMKIFVGKLDEYDNLNKYKRYTEK